MWVVVVVGLDAGESMLSADMGVSKSLPLDIGWDELDIGDGLTSIKDK